jgi:hypothetical protein
LLHGLAPIPLEVVEHQSDPPDPWAGYQRCLENIPAEGHLLIVQDDAIPCEGFADVLPLIAAANPNSPVCLWMSAIPAATAGRIRRAQLRGKTPRYVPLGPAAFVPLVAVLWPVEEAREFARWAGAASRLTRADDANVARWPKTQPREERTEFMVCVPSIVEHDDFTPSVKGGTRGESQGRASDRVALFLAEDARAYNW